eukprot:COSAG06_NODE_53833_length_297_cov_11.136364_1_plen_46_part_01
MPFPPHEGIGIYYFDIYRMQHTTWKFLRERFVRVVRVAEPDEFWAV